MHNFNPNWCVAPGTTIIDAMEENPTKAGTFIKRFLSTHSWQELIDLTTGKLLIDEMLAFWLAADLGGTPQFWLTREKQYREGLAKGLKDCTQDNK